MIIFDQTITSIYDEYEQWFNANKDTLPVHIVKYHDPQGTESRVTYVPHEVNEFEKWEKETVLPDVWKNKRLLDAKLLDVCTVNYGEGCFEDEKEHLITWEMVKTFKRLIDKYNDFDQEFCDFLMQMIKAQDGVLYGKDFGDAPDFDFDEWNKKRIKIMPESLQ